MIAIVMYDNNKAEINLKSSVAVIYNAKYYTYITTSIIKSTT